MVRWLLVGLLLLGLGTGLQRGWLQVRWGVMLRDLGLPSVADGQAADCEPVSPPR
jgi:hypothetical protein